MPPKLLLYKLLVLVFNNSKLSPRLDVDSVYTDVIDYILALKTEKEELTTLSEIIRSVQLSAVPFSKQKLLGDLTMTFPDDSDLESYLDYALSETATPESLQMQVLSDISEIKSALTLPKLGKVLREASFALNKNTMSVRKVGTYTAELIAKIELITTGTGEADAAITSEVDFMDGDDVVNIFNEVQELNNGTSVFTTGWQCLNTGLQGGPRPGDFMMIGALEHNYKSSALRSIFRQIAEYNKAPVYPANAEKKPLLLFYSFEDPMSSVLQYMFQNIEYNRTRKPVKISDYTSEQMRDTVIKLFTANGWHIKFLRVNPTDWTYRSLLESILTYESQGYDIKVIAADYLLQIPTTGCDHSGATGTDLRDMVRRVRNFMAAKKILFMTPGQLNTRVKDMLVDGTPEKDILSVIAGKGMYAGSKQINHDLDISLLIKKVRGNGVFYLDMIIEKHRMPVAIDDALKHFTLPMSPDGMPIIDDLKAKKPMHFSKVPVEY